MQWTAGDCASPVVFLVNLNNLFPILDPSIRQDAQIGMEVGSRMSTKFFIILQESCRDIMSLEDLYNGIAKVQREPFNVKYRRGAKERSCKLSLYTIDNPLGTNVSVPQM